MEFVDFSFIGHQRPLPLMTPGGSDPRVPSTILSTKFKCDFKKCLDRLCTVYFVNNVTLVGKVIQEKRRGLFFDIFCTKIKKERESTPNLFCPICSFCQVASYISRSRFQHP